MIEAALLVWLALACVTIPLTVLAWLSDKAHPLPGRKVDNPPPGWLE